MASHAAIVDSIPLDDGPAPTPVPLSLPAILRQNIPGYKARINKAKVGPNHDANTSGLNGRSSGSTAATVKFGKRRQRRWENSHFYGTKVTHPKSSDFNPCQLNSSRPTFPAPPPSSFFTKGKAPAGAEAGVETVFDDMKAADFGRFSLPIKGLKRSTRRIVSTGGAGEEIVQTIDEHLRTWLDRPEVFMNPDQAVSGVRDDRCILHIDAEDPRDRPAEIVQISRMPHSLVWQIDDSFVRFLVHAVSRYYRVVSFSKSYLLHLLKHILIYEYLPAKSDPSTSRPLVYLLRPNMAPKAVDPFAKLSLETPPTTEWEQSSAAGNATSSEAFSSSASEADLSELDAQSEAGLDSDAWDAISMSEAPIVNTGGERAPTAPMVADIDLDDSDAQEGDETVQAIHPEEVVGPSAPVRRPPPAYRSHHSHALSDIESSTAELSTDEDAASEHSDGIDSLSNSLADLSAAPVRPISSSHPRPSRRAATPQIARDESISREASPTRDGNSLLPPLKDGFRDSRLREKLARSNRAKNGWILPEQTFVEWVTSN